MAHETATDSLQSDCPEPTDSALHFAVRVGLHGQVGRFTATKSNLVRGQKVVCRTERGVETGTVLNRLTEFRHRGAADQMVVPEFDGHILRVMAPEDHLLWSHLVELASEAFESCQTWLRTQALPDQLLEVEPLMDGRTLYFHFLNTVSTETSTHVDRLADIFQQTVATSSFAQQVEAGCGPGCGTSAGHGCGSACSVCVVGRLKKTGGTGRASAQPVQRTK